MTARVGWPHAGFKHGPAGRQHCVRAPPKSHINEARFFRPGIFAFSSHAMSCDQTVQTIEKLLFVLMPDIFTPYVTTKNSDRKK
jgi:hypothetical protein